MAFLRAFGRHLPADVVDNEALAARTGKDASAIEKASGILRRRYAAEGVSVVDLALAAVHDCFEKARLTAADIGLILFSSGSGERSFPGPAAAFAARLGLTSTPAIDLPIASAGSLVGIAFAADMAERYGNILVVASEIMSRRISDADPDTSILFGDGAGACVVSPDMGFARVVDSGLFTDGNYADSLKLEHGGAIQMKGLEVIIQASRKIPRAIADLLQRNRLQPVDVDVFLMHQANINLIKKVAAGLKVPEEKFFCNIADYGNTSSASLLIAASEWWDSMPLEGPMILAAFGAGFSWGAVLALPIG